MSSNERGCQEMLPQGLFLYFLVGSFTGTWGIALTTLTLPSDAWLLIVSKTRKNFSASMADLLWELICAAYYHSRCRAAYLLSRSRNSRARSSSKIAWDFSN